MKSRYNLAFIHFEVERIAGPDEVEGDPEKYLKDLRDVLLHMNYEYPKEVQHHIFWVGINKSGQMRVGIASESSGQKKFSPMSEFIQEIIDRGDETNWLGKKSADERKQARSLYHFDKLEPRYYRLDPEFDWVKFGIENTTIRESIAANEDASSKLPRQVYIHVATIYDGGSDSFPTEIESVWPEAVDISEVGLDEERLEVRIGVWPYQVSFVKDLCFGPPSVYMSVAQFRSMNAVPVTIKELKKIFSNLLPDQGLPSGPDYIYDTPSWK